MWYMAILSPKAYRDKTRHLGLYDALRAMIALFIQMSSLQELCHGSDTNVNESLNQTIAWFAPKNKTYCGSDSLRNRVGMAISIHLVGYETFFVSLLEQMGLTVDDCARYSFRLKQHQRETHLANSKTSEYSEYKRKRQETTYLKLKSYYAKLNEDSTTGKAYKTGSAIEEDLPAGNTIVRCKCSKGVGHTRLLTTNCVHIINREIVECKLLLAFPVQIQQDKQQQQQQIHKILQAIHTKL
jgi:hypothetical protein